MQSENHKIIYFDSGTTNSRIYLLDSNFNVIAFDKKTIGSKDSTLAQDKNILIKGLYELYIEFLSKNSLKDSDIQNIYMSGMVTSKFGVYEVPHIEIPISISDFSKKIYKYNESTLFKRDLFLVPGLKCPSEDFSFVGNMRGEEIEIIGAFAKLKEMDIDKAALILPGSHTHIAYVENGEIVGIISNMTGELFYAIKNDTIIGPTLCKQVANLDNDMVKIAYKNLERFGFNRAIYLVQAMNALNLKNDVEKFSYAEGAIKGGIRIALEYYIENKWKSLDTVVIVGDEYNYNLYKVIFEDSKYISKVIHLSNEKKSFAIDGLKRLVR